MAMNLKINGLLLMLLIFLAGLGASNSVHIAREENSDKHALNYSNNHEIEEDDGNSVELCRDGCRGTGRFRLEKLQDNGWTLITPEGKPTFVVALNHLAPPFYFNIIQAANGLTPCRSFDKNCIQNDLFKTKYGNNWTAATLDFVTNSQKWGFNAAGYEFVPAPGIRHPYLPDLFITNASHLFFQAGLLSFPDVFSAEFNASTNAKVAEWCARDQHIDYPRQVADVIGYYFEDQGYWNVSSARWSNQGNNTGPTDWTAAMRSMLSPQPGKIQYVRWLERRYNRTLAGLNAARKIYNIPSSIQHWDDLYSYEFTAVDAKNPRVIAEDTEFLEVVADRLFSVGAEAVRRHDPGALVFGQRFNSNDCPPPVLAAAGRHFDVISIQPSIFSPTTLDQVNESVMHLVRISQLAGGKPVFVADQSTHFYELEAGGLQPRNCVKDRQGKILNCAANQSEAGVLYSEFLLAISKRPELIGYAHCQYINRAVEQQNSDLILKQGLLDFEGNPHQEYVDAVTRANKQVQHSLRGKATRG
eukprot:m.265383 g.265383  ORF g.265383 m.265383 type:complete len:529 (+) comp61586_c0_seq1:62-1648(+)